MTTPQEHDLITTTKDTAKAHRREITVTPRPHADGCVGCRRDQVCIKCGKPSMLSVVDKIVQPNGRCISGACMKCCAILHKHVDDNPGAVCERVA